MAWVITSETCIPISRELNADFLKDKIELFVQLIAAPSVAIKEVKQQAAELYAIILDPVAPYLKSNHLICIVPDKSLNYVPFAVLFSSDSGKFFVEDHDFIIAPGTTIFLDCAASDRVRNRHRHAENLLCLGDPQLAQRYRQGLAELTAARDEAESIAALYPAAVLLVGAQASESRFKRQTATAEVIHLASHALIDERVPLLSKLLLAPELPEGGGFDEVDGDLHAYELYQIKFPRARLVVLSACQTGRGRSYNGEGVINLARPFLSAGVPVVVASLWNVNSDKTAELMKAFHRTRKEQSLRPPEALCTAQRKLLAQAKDAERASFNWAAFTAIGGVN
jgi:CHAT domain-containing protein